MLVIGFSWGALVGAGLVHMSWSAGKLQGKMERERDGKLRSKEARKREG